MNVFYIENYLGFLNTMYNKIFTDSLFFRRYKVYDIRS